MNDLPVQANAVAAIRISSLKQGLQGDSPEAQKEQIERFASMRNIKIKKFFIFMESASKEEQPVQEAQLQRPFARHGFQRPPAVIDQQGCQRLGSPRWLGLTGSLSRPREVSVLQ